MLTLDHVVVSVARKTTIGIFFEPSTCDLAFAKMIYRDSTLGPSNAATLPYSYDHRGEDVAVWLDAKAEVRCSPATPFGKSPKFCNAVGVCHLSFSSNYRIRCWKPSQPKLSRSCRRSSYCLQQNNYIKLIINKAFQRENYHVL